MRTHSLSFSSKVCNVLIAHLFTIAAFCKPGCMIHVHQFLSDLLDTNVQSASHPFLLLLQVLL
jgi:hypothetical protein